MKNLILLFALCAAVSAQATDGGFLFATFKGEQTPMSEQIYFAVSSDGRQWSALNNAQPVLVSALGEKGVRDPYLLRSHDGKKFYLLATDLSVHFNRDWKRHVQAGSQSIVIWESADLVHWSPPRLVKVAPDDAGCTWAPEAVYDESRKEYLVFWASTTGSDNFSKQRIWAAWTKDFATFGKPFIYIEKPWHVIDTDIVREGENYFRFSKDEQNKSITQEVSTNLLGPWTSVTNFSLGKLQGYEGPECYQLKPAAVSKPATWCLILDHYRAHTGYEPFVTEDLGGGQFKKGEGFTFPFRFRHGSILPVTAEELQRLQTAAWNTPAEDERPVVDASKVATEKIANAALPTLHIVGDSTVKSGGSKGMFGWGERIAPFFDTNKINVVNHAIGGRSARTYVTEGRWAKVAAQIKSGDFVIIQFGHNDQGRIGDPANKNRADGKGIGDETVEDTKPDGTKELVHTFGWYLTQMVTNAQAKGATVILCSPIPHKQRWETERDFANLAQWDEQVAEKNSAMFFDLTLVITDAYRKAGRDQVETLFADKGTHTTDAGARTNAICVVAGLKGLKGNPLGKFLSEQGRAVEIFKPSADTISTNSPYRTK